MIVWLNNEFMPIEKAVVPVTDGGFQYGDGLFETIRVQSGKSLFIKDHLNRLQKSCKYLKLPFPTDVDFSEIISELTEKNNLPDSVGRAKIVLTRGNPSPDQVIKPTVYVTVSPYNPHADGIYRNGWKLITTRTGYAPPLAAHKTLNYLYYLYARNEAIAAFGDEAVILGPAGEVCETSMGNLLICTEGKWFAAKTAFKLPGITEQKLIELLTEHGKTVQTKTLQRYDLIDADTVWVTSSLIGIMPVRKIDGRLIKETKSDLALKYRKLLFG